VAHQRGQPAITIQSRCHSNSAGEEHAAAPLAPSRSNVRIPARGPASARRSRRADIAAALLAHVSASKSFATMSPKGIEQSKYATAGISGTVRESIALRSYTSVTMKGKVSNVVYSAPPGFSLLSIRWNSFAAMEPNSRLAFSWMAEREFPAVPAVRIAQRQMRREGRFPGGTPAFPWHGDVLAVARDLRGFDAGQKTVETPCSSGKNQLRENRRNRSIGMYGRERPRECRRISRPALRR